VASQGDAPERLYRIGEIAPELADLVIGACGSDEQRYATFERAEISQPLAVGATAELDESRSITLRSLVVVGPGQDNTLPAGRAQVVATVDSSAPVDWSRLNLVLRWPNGQDVLPSGAEPQEQGMTFRYLVPLFDTPIEQVQLRVIDPASETFVSWQTALAPAPTRTEIIGQALTNVEAIAERSEAGALHLRLRLNNTSDATLALDERDIVLTQEARQVELPRLDALQTPLAVGETRTVDVVMNFPANQTLTLTVGSFAFRITT
jgi:hypothetical protein